MYKYLVYNNEESLYEWCKTEEEAKKLCDEWIRNSYEENEGFSPEVMSGAIGCAKVVSESHFTETDNRENYRCLHENKEAECCVCEKSMDCEQTEEWYMENYDFVGEVTLKKVEEEDDGNGK